MNSSSHFAGAVRSLIVAAVRVAPTFPSTAAQRPIGRSVMGGLKIYDLTKFKIESRDFQIESQIKSHLVQIESLLLKSNCQKRFNRDLNRITIWVCPSLLSWQLAVEHYLSGQSHHISPGQGRLCIR